MRYWAPFNGDSQDIDSNDGYQDANPITGLQGSVPTFRPFEQMQRELVNLVTKSGLTPDAVIDGIQVAQAIQRGKINYAVDSGAANAYVIALDPQPTAYTAGMRVWFMPANTNTGASTINVNGRGIADIVRMDGSACQGGDLIAGAGMGLIYNGTNFNLITVTPQQIKQLAFARFRTVLTTPGAYTFTVPAGVFWVVAKAWGGGGGGGGAAAGNPGGAASGGGGGAYTTFLLSVTPGATITGNVAAGGGAGTSGANGGGGGNSTFVFGGLAYTAGGGAGGLSATGPGIAQNSVSGGATTNGDITSHIGAVSRAGGFNNNITQSWAAAGDGGSAPLGGAGGNAGAANGNGGATPGGGGGGGGGTVGSVAVGGAGARGEVWFEY